MCLQSCHFFSVLLLNGTSTFLRIPRARMWCYLLPTLSVIAVQLQGQCRETHVRHTRHKGLLPSTPLQLELSSTPTQETYSAAPQTISGKESTTSNSRDPKRQVLTSAIAFFSFREKQQQYLADQASCEADSLEVQPATSNFMSSEIRPEPYGMEDTGLPILHHHPHQHPQPHHHHYVNTPVSPVKYATLQPSNQSATRLHSSHSMSKKMRTESVV